MSLKKIINSQNDETWAELNKRFMNNEVDYSNILSADLLAYLNCYAIKNGTNLGYVLPSLLTTINYIASKQNCKIEIRNGYSLNLNTYFIFVGQPSTGKSPAIKSVISKPLEQINLSDEVISSSTSSGMSKLLSNNNSAYIVNPEIQEYLMKIIKNNDENCSGDVEMLCKVYSGESFSLNYGTENRRVIKEDCTLCILGSTQIKTMAFLLSQLDKGNGLLERFIISIPRSFRPLPNEQIEAFTDLQEYQFDFADIYKAIMELDKDNVTVFYFSDAVQKLYNQMETQFLVNLNDDLQNGKPTSKSKKNDLLPKIAVSLHILESCFRMLQSQSNVIIPEEIDLDILIRSSYYLDALEDQKGLFLNFIMDILDNTKLQLKTTPSDEEYILSILNIPGKVVSFRSFKQCATKKYRGLMRAEFMKILEKLVSQGCGTIKNVRVTGAPKATNLYIKNEFKNLPIDLQSKLNSNTYEAKRLATTPKSITTGMLEALQ